MQYDMWAAGGAIETLSGLAMQIIVTDTEDKPSEVQGVARPVRSLILVGDLMVP